MGKVEIYYFSGTGNSLYVAKNYKKNSRSKSDSNCKPLKKDVIKANGDTVGFVFSIHGMTIPIPVKKFIKKLDLNSTKYIFAIATRAGTQHIPFMETDNILKKRGRSLNSYFTLNMASNDPKFKDYRPATSEEIEKLESEIQRRHNSIQEVIIKQENSREKYSEFIPVSSALGRLVSLEMPTPNTKVQKIIFMPTQNAQAAEHVKRFVCPERPKWLMVSPYGRKMLNPTCAMPVSIFVPYMPFKLKPKST